MGNPIVHFEIRVQDPEKTTRFYTELFDWKIAPDDKTGNIMVYTGEHPPGSIRHAPQPSAAGVTNYIRVNDIDKALAKVEELGGKQVTGRSVVPGLGYWATFTDPEGNLMGLWEHIPVPEVDPSLLA